MGASELSVSGERAGGLPLMSDSRKLISSIQIIIGLLVTILVIATPFAYFRYSGYGAFNLGNNDIKLVGAAVAITALIIAYFGYVWGWKSAGKTTSKYAKMTLYLGAFQWIWVISLVLAIWNEITYNATFSIGLGGYSWWLGTASYATLIGAVIFTITGLMAVREAKATPPLPPPPPP